MPPVASLTTRLKQWHAANKKITLVTGVFDLLHEEHVLFLQKAQRLGEVLIVGLESDARVRDMKGAGRPIYTARTRAHRIRRLHLADAVFILPQKFNNPSDREALIRWMRPNFLAVSSHTAHLDAKKQILEKFGGKVVVVHEHNPNVSTTQLLAKQARNK